MEFSKGTRGIFQAKSQENLRPCAKLQENAKQNIRQDSNGSAIVDPASQAELISECFSTAYRHDNGSHSPPFYK